MVLIGKIKQYFSFLSISIKYGGFNIANDRYLGIDKFKDKYEKLKQYPDYEKIVLSNQTLEPFYDFPEHLFFLVCEFPDYFDLTKPSRLTSTPIASQFSLIKDNKDYLRHFYNALFKKYSTCDKIIEINNSDLRKLFLESIKLNNYGLFLILIKNYKIDFITEKEQWTFNETLPWFYKLVDPTKNNISNIAALHDLHIAIMHKDKQSIELLMGADNINLLLNHEDELKRKPLTLAIEQGYLEGADIIFNKMQALTDANKREIGLQAILAAYNKNDLETALIIANEYLLCAVPLNSEKYSLIDLLAKDNKLANKKVNVALLSNEQYRRALNIAAKYGNLKDVQYLLEQKDVELNPKDYINAHGKRKREIFKNCYNYIKNRLHEQAIIKFYKSLRFEVAVENYKRISVGFIDFNIESNEFESDRYFGKTPLLHNAISEGNAFVVQNICDENNANIYLENQKGLSALEFALQLDNQEVFNVLLGYVDIKNAGIRVQKKNFVSCDVMLNKISSYLQSYPNMKNAQTISFFWNYFGKSFYERAKGNDRLKIAYFFKSLYIDSIEKNIDIEPLNNGLDERVILAKKICEFSKLDNAKTMISLNTGKYGLSIGGSSIHAKIYNLLVTASRKIPCTLHDIHNNLNRLIQKLFSDDEFYASMKAQVSDINQLSQDRSIEYLVTNHIDQATNPARMR